MKAFVSTILAVATLGFFSPMLKATVTCPNNLNVVVIEHGETETDITGYSCTLTGVTVDFGNQTVTCEYDCYEVF
ncbi:MAG: hypothetical protein FWG02_11580 [Holophagaceae bacterium]|nr:hypothetical protein [Holophagaceae bacterium]